MLACYGGLVRFYFHFCFFSLSSLSGNVHRRSGSRRAVIEPPCSALAGAGMHADGRDAENVRKHTPRVSDSARYHLEDYRPATFPPKTSSLVDARSMACAAVSAVSAAAQIVKLALLSCIASARRVFIMSRGQPARACPPFLIKKKK